MAHFAKIENQIVTQLIVVDNADCGNLEFPESEPVGKRYIESLGMSGEWLQASYNGNFRKNYPTTGYMFDKHRDAFVPPVRYPSWILNETTCQWEPPVAWPNDGKLYTWNESTKTWDLSS